MKKPIISNATDSEDAARETREMRKVSLEELKGKTVPEQFHLLEARGYHKCLRNPFIRVSPDEWRKVIEADKDGNNILGEPEKINLTGFQKFTTPFVLLDEYGAVIDEYNFISFYYREVTGTGLIAECWFRGGEQETALTVPLFSESMIDAGVDVPSFNAEDYTLTVHDVKSFEAGMRLRYGRETKITRLSNGRFALAVRVLTDKCWIGFPACGDGNMEHYKKNIMSYLFESLDKEPFYKLGNDDSNSVTFASWEAAYSWANYLGIVMHVESQCYSFLDGAIYFESKEHEQKYYELVEKYGAENRASYKALFYLLTSTLDIRYHLSACFGISGGEIYIKSDALRHDWVTGGDARIIRLAFNLFTGGCPTSGHLRGEKKEMELLKSTPAGIFFGLDETLTLVAITGLFIRANIK